MQFQMRERKRRRATFDACESYLGEVSYFWFSEYDIELTLFLFEPQFDELRERKGERLL